MAVYTERSPVNTDVFATNMGGNTIIDLSWTVDNGATITKFECKPNNIDTAAFSAFILEWTNTPTTPSNFTVVAEEDFVPTSSSGDWEEFTWTTPYVVPSSGAFYVGMYAAAGVSPTFGYDSTADRAYWGSKASIAGSPHEGVWTHDNSNCPMVGVIGTTPDPAGGGAAGGTARRLLGLVS